MANRYYTEFAERKITGDPPPPKLAGAPPAGGRFAENPQMRWPATSSPRRVHKAHGRKVKTAVQGNC